MSTIIVITTYLPNPPHHTPPTTHQLQSQSQTTTQSPTQICAAPPGPTRASANTTEMLPIGAEDGGYRISLGPVAMPIVTMIMVRSPRKSLRIRVSSFPLTIPFHISRKGGKKMRNASVSSCPISSNTRNEKKRGDFH